MPLVESVMELYNFCRSECVDVACLPVFAESIAVASSSFRLRFTPAPVLLMKTSAMIPDLLA